MNEAYAALERWGQTFNAGDVDAVAALHAPGATICGTLGRSVTTTPHDINNYFVEAARAGLQVKFGEHVSSPISDACVIEAGHYNFSPMADGQTAIFPAIQFCAGEAEQRVADRASAFVLPAQTCERVDKQKGRPCGRPL